MDVNSPLVGIGSITRDQSLVVALIIGIAFGFFLERGGLGNARKLSGQFYFTDFTVLKVMFSAILTASLGLFVLSRMGLIDLQLIHLLPTHVYPQLVGGLIFGVGFVVGGLCPGTACVAASSGRIDGLVLMVGLLGGIAAFNEAYPMIASFYHGSDLRQITLGDYFGLAHGSVLFVITLMALAAFFLAELIERRSQ